MSISELSENIFEHEQNISESGSQESFISQEEQVNIGEIIKGLFDLLNYSGYYLKLKEINKNEKYIILFTDILNTYNITDEIISKNINNLKERKHITFLFVGKNKKIDTNNNNNTSDFNETENITKIITEKFGEKSELINYENMKKIKIILSSNVVIKDEIIYPNEIYK